MNTIKPHRLHPIWDIVVFVWIALSSAGIGILQKKDFSLWLMLGAAAVSLCILTVLCVKFTLAQGCDIFIMTEDAVPKRKICMRFIIEFCTVIFTAVIAGALITFFAVPENTAQASEAPANQEASENQNQMNFGSFSDMSEIPEGMGENGFTFPADGAAGSSGEGASFDFSSGNPFGDRTASSDGGTVPTADTSTERSSGMMPPSGYSRETTASSETSGASGASGRPNMQRPQSSEGFQYPGAAATADATGSADTTDAASPSDASPAADGTVDYFLTMALLAILYILTAIAALAVSVNRYNPYDDWEWKYEYADEDADKDKIEVEATDTVEDKDIDADEDIDEEVEDKN